MLSLANFEERVGAPFQIRATPRPIAEVVVEASVEEIEFPNRVVFSWTAPGMIAPATAEFALRETEHGVVFSVNRLTGDPETCNLATKIMGSNWRTQLFSRTVAANLSRVQIRPD